MWPWFQSTEASWSRTHSQEVVHQLMYSKLLELGQQSTNFHRILRLQTNYFPKLPCYHHWQKCQCWWEDVYLSSHVPFSVLSRPKMGPRPKQENRKKIILVFYCLSYNKSLYYSINLFYKLINTWYVYAEYNLLCEVIGGLDLNEGKTNFLL